MKCTTKGILTAIPLVIGLAGPAAAALSDTSTGDGADSKENIIDKAFNKFTGLPGDDDGQISSHNQQHSTFTASNGVMASYFTNKGVDRSSPNEPLVPEFVIGTGARSESSSSVGSNGADPGAAAAAPAVAANTIARYAPDTLVGSVASSSALTPSNASTSGLKPTANEPVATPIPPAAVLIGSGLTALAALRRRKQDLLPE